MLLSMLLLLTLLLRRLLLLLPLLLLLLPLSSADPCGVCKLNQTAQVVATARGVSMRHVFL